MSSDAPAIQPTRPVKKSSSPMLTVLYEKTGWGGWVGVVGRGGRSWGRVVGSKGREGVLVVRKARKEGCSGESGGSEGGGDRATKAKFPVCK